jgi:hypothetical protein
LSTLGLLDLVKLSVDVRQFDSQTPRRGVLSAPPEAIRVPSGLNATLYRSGYVECADGRFGGGCRKRYDFVPYMGLPDGWFTKDGNSYCAEHWPMVRR